MNIKNTLVLALCLGILLFSCKDDSVPNLTIYQFDVDTTYYTPIGGVVIKVSTDNGATFSTTIPTTLAMGASLIVQVTDGTELLNTDLFLVDWSKSDPVPNTTNGAEATFNIVDDDVSVVVVVEDILDLLTSNKATGQVSSIDLTNKEMTDAFFITENDENINEIRSLIYNTTNGKYYMTRNSTVGGGIYTIDPETRVATEINNNANNDWNVISDLVVLSNGNILCTMDSNVSPAGQSLAQFSTLGIVSQVNILFNVGNGNICCGMGLTTLPNSSNYMVGDEKLNVHYVNSTGQGETFTYKLNAAFTDLNVAESRITSLTQNHDGNIFGIMYDKESDISYLVSIDLPSTTISEVMVLGSDGENQYQALKFIPKYTYN